MQHCACLQPGCLSQTSSPRISQNLPQTVGRAGAAAVHTPRRPATCRWAEASQAARPPPPSAPACVGMGVCGQRAYGASWLQVSPSAQQARRACKLNTGSVWHCACSSSPLRTASIMARVCSSGIRRPTPYLQGQRGSCRVGGKVRGLQGAAAGLRPPRAPASGARQQQRCTYLPPVQPVLTSHTWAPCCRSFCSSSEAYFICGRSGFRVWWGRASGVWRGLAG